MQTRLLPFIEYVCPYTVLEATLPKFATEIRESFAINTNTHMKSMVFKAVLPDNKFFELGL